MILSELTFFFALLQFLQLFINSLTQDDSSKKIFCIYSTKSADNLESEGFDYYKVEDINEKYCTHLIYTYMGVADDGNIKSLNPQLDFEENGGIDNLIKFTRNKQFNNNLKKLAAVGGWDSTENSKRYSDIFKNIENQKRFVKSVVNFCNKFHFDGIALHWIYPGLNGGDPRIDKITFTSLLKLLKEELSKQSLIVVAICHGLYSKIPQSYNVKEISQNVDYIYLTSYDFYGKWSQHIGISSALYLHPRENDKDLSVDSVINSWIIKGAQREKIIMGIPLFGRTFTLKYRNQTEPGSPHIGTGEPEIISYRKLCKRLKEESASWTVKWEELQKNPYAYNDDLWIGFENERSLEIKSKYVLNRNLAGVAVAHVSDDDFQERCGEKYHLLKVINNHLREEYSSEFIYVYNFNVFKKSFKDNHTECIYHRSGNVDINKF